MSVVVSPKRKTERERDVERKRKSRAKQKTVEIPRCADRRRRKRLEADDFAWLRWYCGELFWYEFTRQQMAMIDAIRNAIVYGGDQALAASRGEGKTKLCERMLLKYALSGRIKCAILFAATGAAAENSLQSMRDEIERNERLLADYPEVCVPVRALEDTPNRAHYQLVTGKRHDTGRPYSMVSSRFTWCGHEIILPNVPGSPAAWGVIATRGLDSAVRGFSKKNMRPEVAVIDDPDTEDTVRSLEQAGKLEDRIDGGIAGLGGQQRGVARIVLTTLQKADCASAWYTDPKRKPSFKGKRFRFLIKPPDRLDLWAEYVELWRQDMQLGDAFARRAYAFYLANRAAMDAGAEVANPHRFNPQILPDGTQLEVSSLQRYYNEVARIGQVKVSTEFDNDPPADEKPESAGLTAEIVASRLSGFTRRVVPPHTKRITVGLDLSDRSSHWVAIAWRDGCAGQVIDYGILEVVGVEKGSSSQTKARAILDALHRWRAELLATPFKDEDGQERAIDLACIDSGDGDHTEATYRFCQEVGQPFCAAKGRGGYRSPAPAPGRYVGNHWFRSRLAQGIWLVVLDADHWKKFVHARFLTPTRDENQFIQAGSLSIFSPQQPREHQSYSHHIMAEVWVQSFVEGRGVREYWYSRSKNNHYFDATSMACAAADMMGIRLLGSIAPQRRPGLAEYFERAQKRTRK